MKMHLERIGYHDVWMGGYNDLKIAWIPKGTMFYIHEYDGSESIETPKSCGMNDGIRLIGRRNYYEFVM